ncbi:MAG: membrane protein insertase YidC [Parcubacteria group bacterium]|nr:membrane protein insertase YidC [Parcubacteria group bacterium]
MIGDAFHIVFYQPLYNGLVFLVSWVPFADVGIAIITLTILVKFVLLPLTHKSTKAQRKIKEIEPEVTKLREKHKEDKQIQAQKMMELYKEHGINPFSGCLLFIVQIPFIIALYWVFWKGIQNGNFDPGALYSFVDVPATVNLNFLSLVNMSEKSVVLALLAGISQYFQIKLSIPTLPESTNEGNKPSLKDDFMRSFQLQMKYGLPIFVAFIAYTISSAVALYWVTSNVFTIIHELYVRHKAKKVTLIAKSRT